MPRQQRHVFKVHAVDTGDNRGWKKDDSGDREDFDDLVLFDVDEALCGVHQEIDFVEQERGVREQGVNVAHDFVQIFSVFTARLKVAQQE